MSRGPRSNKERLSMRDLFHALLSEFRQSIPRAVNAAFDAGVRARAAVDKWFQRA